MPYIAALFDEQQQASMREAAQRIAVGSAFVPQKNDPFHIQIQGGLHHYSDEAISAAIAATPPLRGRFVRWEIVQQQLRAAVECDPAVLDRLHAALPQGKPWRTRYVRIGSVAGIEKTKHDEFLAAVQAAFPMDASLEFTTYLAYHNVPMPQPPKDAMQTVKTNSKTNKKPQQQTKAKKLNPKRAIPCEPPARSVTIQKKSKKKQQQKTSPHRKWEKPSTGVTGRSAVDALIRSAAAAGS